MNRRKLNIAIEVLNKVPVEFPETNAFIDGKLGHKYSKENTFIKEVIYFPLTSEAKSYPRKHFVQGINQTL